MLSRLLSSLGPLAPLVVFGLAAAESALFLGFVIPGEVAVILGGVAAGTGVTPLWLSMVAAVGGAVVGDSIGYEVGTRAGKSLTARAGRRREQLERASSLVADRGWWALVVARFAAVLRAMVPFAAGLGGMPYRRFALGNVIGGVLWGVTFTLVGYLAGANYPVVEHWVRTGGLAVVAVVALFALIALAARWVAHHPAGTTERIRRIVSVRPLRRLGEMVTSSRLRGPVLAATGAGAVGLLWVFGALAQDVLGRDEFFLFDLTSIRYLADHPLPVLVTPARVVDAVTRAPVLLVVAALLSVRMLKRRPGFVFTLWTALAGQWAITELAARLIHRTPPSVEPLVTRVDYGFPSEHVAMLAALALVVAWPWFGSRWPVAVARLGVAAGVVALVAVARVVLLVDFPSDVVAAAAVGTGWALLSCVAFARAPAGDDSTHR